MALVDCSDCGERISDKAERCIHCGCPVAQRIDCPECGKSTDSASGSCQHCGYPLTAEPVAKEAPKAQSAVDRIEALEDKVSPAERTYKYNLSNTTCWMYLLLAVGFILLSISVTYESSLITDRHPEEAKGAMIGTAFQPFFALLVSQISPRFRNFSGRALILLSASTAFFVLNLFTTSGQL